MIKLKNLSKVFGSESNLLYALNDINLKINQGEALIIFGQSGSGKTTLLDILGTLQKPTEGSYLLNNVLINNYTNKELAYLRNKMFGFIFQTYPLLLAETVYDNVKLPLNYSKIEKTHFSNLIEESLELVGLSHKINSIAKNLSGGEQQRVSIARAIVTDPDIIFADEPTGNLDSKTGNKIIDLLLNLNAKGKTLVLVSHNDNILSLFPRKIRLLDGKIIQDEVKKI